MQTCLVSPAPYGAFAQDSWAVARVRDVIAECLAAADGVPVCSVAPRAYGLACALESAGLLVAPLVVTV